MGFTVSSLYWCPVSKRAFKLCVVLGEEIANPFKNLEKRVYILWIEPKIASIVDNFTTFITADSNQDSTAFGLMVNT